MLLLAVFVRILANPLANVFQKQLTQRAADPRFIMAITYGLLTTAGLVFWPSLRFIDLPVAFWQSMLVAGLFAMAGNVFLIKALQIGDLSVLGPINAYKSVVGVVLSAVLLNEIPGWWGFAGILLIVVGSYVVLADTTQPPANQPAGRSGRAIFQRADVRLRLAALLFSAIDGTFLKKAILLSTPTVAFFYWCLFGFAFTLVWLGLATPRLWRGQFTLFVSQKTTYAALTLAVGLTQLASNIVLARMQVSYALALFQTSALVSVLFGYRFFNEQGIVRKLIGAGIMVAGAVLITVLG